MANWVDCLLIASGSKKDLKKMIRQSEMNKEDCSDEHLSDWLEMRAEWIDEPGFTPYSLDEECAEVQFAESCAAAFFKTAWDLPEYFFDNFLSISSCFFDRSPFSSSVKKILFITINT